MTEATAEQQLDALASQAQEIDTTPEQAETERAGVEAEIQEAAELAQGAKAAADLTVGIVASLLEAIAPPAALDGPTKGEAVAKLQPLFEKYGIALGGAGRWAVEIDAAIFFGMTGFTAWQKIQAHQAEQAKAKQEAAASGSEPEYQSAE